MQKTQIATLRMQIEESQARLMHFRPMSRERLPPMMDEFARTHNAAPQQQALLPATR